MATLITGATGWLGSQLAAAIGPSVRSFVGDLRDRSACQRFCDGASGATLFHTAGVIHPARVREFYSINVEGTTNLLDAAMRAGVRRVVVVSSNSPFGFNPEPAHVFTEDSPYHPYGHYGRSKMAMELAVKAAEASGTIETVIVRAPWFYGTNQPDRQTEFFRMIRNGTVPVVGSGENRRSMAYLDNLCDGLLLAAAAPVSGQAFWIADERPYTMNEIIGTVEKVLEEDFGLACARTRRRLPAVVGRAAEFADAAIQGVGLYDQKIHVLSEMGRDIACSVARARDVLGYRPAVALREGMRRSIEWCLADGGRI